MTTFSALKNLYLSQEKGNGYSRDIYSGDESKVTTIRRLYAKGGSCEQFLQHPEDETKFRLFTDKEHCRIKKVPEELIANLSQTSAHEIMKLIKERSGEGQHAASTTSIR